MSSRQEEPSKDDTFKILVATDIHLGYQISGKQDSQTIDSFTTFEEILQYGKKHKVDFVLLGGDLFHDSKPTPDIITKCLELIHKYSYGPGDIKMEFLTEPSVVFEHCSFKNVNYEDPNVNIDMPIFSIHGNHDNPNLGGYSTIDILSTCNHINYFGKWTDFSNIELTPMIFKKGKTYIALYGLGYISDRRLFRLIRDNKFTMKRPKGIPECFNIFVLHQNRVRHEQDNYVPENKLPPFLDLIIWGHEHECRIVPEIVVGAQYYISQPGSSVATSLCANEAVPKHVGLLYINRLKYKIKKLKLNTVRPFVFDTILLHNHPVLEEKKKICKKIDSYVIFEFIDDYIENNLITKAATQLTGHPKQPHLPLIRLRVFYNNENEIFETTPLIQKYCDKIANPANMILFRKNTVNEAKFQNPLAEEWMNLFPFENDASEWTSTIREGISKYFETEENKDSLTVLSVRELNQALSQYVEKSDKDAFQAVIRHKMEKTIDHLQQQDIQDPKQILDKIKEFRDKSCRDMEEEQVEVSSFLNDKTQRTYLKAHCSKKSSDN